MEYKYNFKKNFFIFIIISSIFTYIKSNNPKPLSFCTKGRIGKLLNFEKGKCGFGTHNGSMDPLYRFPSSINQDSFQNSAQCGICYEIVGPLGVIRTRVEDSCPKDSDTGLCNGDMYHFNIIEEGSTYIMGSANNANITFRMISCDFEGNIRILTNEKTNQKYLSFVVLDHNIGVSYIKMNENNSTIWKNLQRTNENNWVYYDIEKGISFPLKLKIYSINGDHVSIDMDTPQKEK